MSGRAKIVLHNDAARARAVAWMKNAPEGTVVDLRESTRSLEQNALMWVLLGKVSKQANWHGLKLSADDWKILLTAALKRELRMVPNMDGDGFVQLGTSTSSMSIPEMSDLIELIYASADRLGVDLTNQSSSRDSGGDNSPEAAAA